MNQSQEQSAGLEDAVLPVIRRYVRHFLGRTPRTLSLLRTGNILVTYMTDLLTDAEMRLLQSDTSPASREMIEQMFRKLVRQSQESLIGAVQNASGANVGSVLCDIDCTVGTGVLVLVCDS